MWKVIKEGKHDSSFIPSVHFGKITETYRILFDKSCEYDLGDAEAGEFNINQFDWNKLFGFSYGWHKKNSIRFGWRHNLMSGDIDLCLYIYKDGRRIIEKIPGLYINELCDLSLTLHDGYIEWKIQNVGRPGSITGRYFIKMKKSWGYNLGLYFGGNETAPNDMYVWMERCG